MLKIITTLTVFLIGILAKGQVTENRNVSAFSKVTVAHGIELIYTENPSTSLQIETGSQTALNEIITEVHGKTLKIAMEKGIQIPSNETVKVYLSVQNIVALEAHSKAKITIIDQFNAKHLNILLDSGATLTGNIKTLEKTKLYADNGTVFNGKIETKILKGNFKSNARINLTGKAENASFVTSDSALMSAKNFSANTINLNANGKSIAMIHANTNVALNVTDDARVSYTGLPQNIELNDEAQASKKVDYNHLVSYNDVSN